MKSKLLSFMKNDLNGFTLVESMLALLILSIILLLSNAVLKSTKSIQVEAGQDCQVEWHLFLNQFDYMRKDWKLTSIQTRKLLFEDDKGTFELSAYKNQLRIKKNGGYEPVLTRVQKTEFVPTKGGVTFKIKMEDGEEYRATFYKW